MGFVVDTFTDADGTLIENHTGETGATWTQHPEYPRTFIVTSNRIRLTGFGTGLVYASGIPPSAEYDVECDFVVITDDSNEPGITGRMSTTDLTFYLARYNPLLSPKRWELKKYVNNVVTTLGTFNETIGAGNTRRAKLEIRNATKKLYVDSIERISSTDNAITETGRAGIHGWSAGGAAIGIHLDNYEALVQPIIYSESPSLIALFSPSALAPLTGKEILPITAAFITSLADSLGRIFFEVPSSVFLLLPSVDDLRAFQETPTQTFMLTPTIQENYTFSEILSILAQFGIIIPNFVPIPETVSAQWNEQGQVMFGDDESQPSWGWASKIIESITYPRAGKRETVRSRVESS